jgi:hypothetical protein
MGEKNILAYFKTHKEAESVAKHLKSMGIQNIKIDRFSKYPGDGVEVLNNPITGNVSSLANLTSNTDVNSRDAGILAAADIDASGMSDGGQEITGRDVLLTAVVDEARLKQTLKAIENAGGRV